MRADGFDAAAFHHNDAVTFITVDSRWAIMSFSVAPCVPVYFSACARFIGGYNVLESSAQRLIENGVETSKYYGYGWQ